MKKIVTFTILTCMLLSIFIMPQYQIQADSISSVISIYIDGQKIALDTKPIIDNNRTLVPLRGVFEKLGATVDWNKETSQAIVKNKTIEVLIEPNNQAVLVNGQVQFLDTTSRIQDGRILVPIRFVAETLGYKVTWNATNYRIDISTKVAVAPVIEDKLPTLGSSAAFSQLLHYNNVLSTYISSHIKTVDTAIPPTAPTPTPTPAKPTAPVAQPSSPGIPTKSSEDFSGTNNQTEGVDEGDIIKTNGKNIFSLNQNSVHIINPNPIKPEIISTIDVPSQRGNVTDIYIESNHLVLIGTSYVMYGYPKDLIANFGPDFAPTYSTSNTFVLVYDITDPTKPVLSKDMDYEGSYVSSRLIQDKLYVISSKSLNYWGIYPMYRTAEPFTGTKGPSIAPDYSGSSNPTGLSDLEFKQQLEALYDYQFKPKYANNITGKVTVMDYNNIHYFPNYITPNYMLTIGIDLASDAVDVKTYLGSAEIVYASEDNLYLSFTKYEYATQFNSLLYIPSYNKATVIYKFKLENGQINYEARGSVPGSALNQFSLGEFNGNLRIATTTGEMWDQTNISKNNIYVLNSKLKEIGSLTDLAPGERIYSTRFAGNRIYMVTFKQVDPFFVIDATDPTAPKVLGYLKVPGFSSYMHLLDENHVLGFGSDTVEQDGRVTTGGFKISLFDVTNPAAPVEKSKEVIGVAGTYSELQNNHKALMISLNKGIMAFPITVAGRTPYVTDFSGAYVYNISTDAFSFKGTVTHQTAETVINSGDYKYYDYNYNINRLVYIGDYLYSLSQGKMEVTSLKDMTKSGEVAFPVKVYDNGGVVPIGAPPILK
jgi:inhibitor of cysteine peptidase